MRLHQEVALVTGGGSGIGYAIVERFIAEGASVGVLIKEEKDALPLKQAFGEKVEVTLGDVRNFTDNQRAVAATVARFGKLDCFIGNAGIGASWPVLKHRTSTSSKAVFTNCLTSMSKGMY